MTPEQSPSEIRISVSSCPLELAGSVLAAPILTVRGKPAGCAAASPTERWASVPCAQLVQNGTDSVGLALGGGVGAAVGVVVGAHVSPSAVGLEVGFTVGVPVGLPVGRTVTATVEAWLVETDTVSAAPVALTILGHGFGEQVTLSQEVKTGFGCPMTIDYSPSRMVVPKVCLSDE